MAANMYRVGGMYVNVDLFLSNRNPSSFASPWGLCGVILVGLQLIVRYGCATLTEMR